MLELVLWFNAVVPWYGANFVNMDDVPARAAGISFFHFHGLQDTDVPPDGGRGFAAPWGMTARAEQRGSGAADDVDGNGYIAVFPQGSGDNTHNGGPLYSWRAAGTTQSPGPAGVTCT